MADELVADETESRLAPVAYLPGAYAADDRASSNDEPEWEPSGDDASLQLDEAVTVSTRALARKDLSRRELEKLLRSHDLDENVIEERVAHLESVGLVDDMALAQHLVGTLQERKGLGRSAIAAELARRMFAPAAIGYALELVDSGDELARARELAHKRARQLTSLDRDVAERRLSAFLARRGYSGSAVRAAVESALPARGSAGSTVRFR